MRAYTGKYAARWEKALGKKLKRIYAQAQTEVQQKMEAFTKKHEAKDRLMREKLDNGEITEDEYMDWLQGQVFIGGQWRQKVEDISRVYVNADKRAREIIGGTERSEFVRAANSEAYDIARNVRIGSAFDIYDENTVSRLLKDKPQTLPRWKIDEPKDYVWNARRVRNSVTQSIIQGEGIPGMARRLAKELSTSNTKHMVLFARTAVTGAENAGRLERMHEAQDKGIVVMKKWVATLDDRTRDSHKDLDGTVVGIDDYFVTEDGNRLKCPGDPSAPPEEVYNCRCTMITVYPQYEHLFDPGERLDQRTDTIVKLPKVEPIPILPAEEVKPETTTEFTIPEKVRREITDDDAYSDWFEYEKANVMREFIRTGEMPTRNIYGDTISTEDRQKLAAEAERIQQQGEVNKTKHKTLKRGMVLSKEDAEAITKGDYYVFDSITATSPDEQIASIYTNPENNYTVEDGVPVMLEIKKLDGIYGFATNPTEVILPKGSAFKITRKYKDEDGVLHITLSAKKGYNVWEDVESQKAAAMQKPDKTTRAYSGEARRMIGDYGIIQGEQTRQEIVEMYKEIDRVGGIQYSFTEDGRLDVKMKRETYQKLDDMARTMASRVTEKNDDFESDYKEIMEFVSREHVYFSKYDRHDIVDFPAWAKSKDNNVWLSLDPNAMPLDTLYEDLRLRFPGYFPEGHMTPADRLLRINDVINMLKASKRVLAKEAYSKESYEALTNDLFRALGAGYANVSFKEGRIK